MMVENVFSLLVLLVVVLGGFYASLLMGYSAYYSVRKRNARPLTDEERWQETSAEPRMSEEEWSALLATERGTTVKDGAA